jgi:hypothetical protein
MARRRKQTTKPKVVTKSGRNTKVASPKIAKPLHDVTFPNESASYRVARNDLLKAEMDLRRQIEHVATMRAKLPPGGGVPTDYIFEEGGKSLEAKLCQLMRGYPAKERTRELIGR